MTDTIEQVKASRQAVYGDPWENHKGIGQQWGAILRHVGRHIRDGGDVPPSLVAACMAAVKLNRMRVPGVHHEDNATDAHAYLDFADEFRRRELREPRVQADRQPQNGVHRIYVAGPYSASSPGLVEYNCSNARAYARRLMKKGHMVHLPHDATHHISESAIAEGTPFDYEDWMRLDFSIIERWATAVYLVAKSPGADREVELAKRLGLTVFTDPDQVPFVGTST
jgi:hypothetical protein